MENLGNINFLQLFPSNEYMHMRWRSFHLKRLIIVVALLLLTSCESKNSLSFDVLSPTPSAAYQTNERAVEPSLLPALPESTTSIALQTPALKDLSATLIPSENGFKLEPENKYGNFFVMQTLQIPNSPRVVHIMRMIEKNESNETRFQESAVIIHADTQEMHIYSMMNAPITDEYSETL